MAIDYGRYPMSSCSLPNRDPETGIRYGIAKLCDLAEWALEEFEAVYAQGCPHCGDILEERADEDFTCAACGKDVEFDESWGDEPIDWTYESDSLKLRLDESNDVWVFYSADPDSGQPITTTGEHCSPCAPGAVSVHREPVEGGPRAYTLPADWWAEED